MEGIGNDIGQFVKASEIKKRQRHAAYTHICVHMNISQPVLESIDLVYHDFIWTEPSDFEYVPVVQCHRCHEYVDMFHDCPLTITEEAQHASQDTDDEGFEQVGIRRNR